MRVRATTDTAACPLGAAGRRLVYVAPAVRIAAPTLRGTHFAPDRGSWATLQWTVPPPLPPPCHIRTRRD